MQPQHLSIPRFRPDSYLPDGLHLASKDELLFRFGSSSRRRRRLVIRIQRWIDLAHRVGALRLLIDGSFVTGKDDSEDIDAVILLPADFQEQIERGIESALELEEMILTRRPEEIFVSEDEADWNEWVDFFSRTREADGTGSSLLLTVLEIVALVAKMRHGVARAWFMV